MYRLYNPNSGEHFYTANLDERETVWAAGWIYEGIGWVAPVSSAYPVYRLYNPNAGDHHYTLSESERDWLRSLGWRYEGVGWYSSSRADVPVYREYNPNAKSGAHNFTTDKSENDMLVKLGWHDEGTAWYAAAPACTEADTAVTKDDVITRNKTNIYINPYQGNATAGSSEAGIRYERVSEADGWSRVRLRGLYAYIETARLYAVRKLPAAPADADGFRRSRYNGQAFNPAAYSRKKICFGLNQKDKGANGVPSEVSYFMNNWKNFDADWICNTNKKIIYLTFDDGYGNSTTGKVLDVLKTKGVKATFYLVGSFVKDRPDLTRRMINEGHQIGSHTMNHPDFVNISTERQISEIISFNDMMKNKFGYDIKLFRFPSGEFSDEGLALVNNMGLKAVFYSYAYYDYDEDHQPSRSSALSGMIGGLHPGAIYMLHANSTTSAAVLGSFIDAARARGYTFADDYPTE